MACMKDKLICAFLAMLVMININISAKAEKISFEFKFEKPTIKKIGNEYTIEMKNCLRHEYNGFVIPAKPLHILLPPGKEVDKIEVHGKRVFIGKYEIEKEKPLIVNGRKFSPAIKNEIKRAYEKVGVYGLRGYNILVINLLPILYENEKLYYYKKMKVDIFLKEGKPNHLYRGLEKDRQLVKNIVINPWILNKYEPVKCKEEYEYLIITSNAFKKAYERIAEYKESKGIKTKIISVEEIVSNPKFWNETRKFNDTQAIIRNYIKYAYKNLGIDYVLLAGDGDIQNESSNIIPPRYLYAVSVGLPLSNDEVLEAYIPSDVYYACLDGNWNNDGDNKWGENASGNDVSNEDEADLYAEVWVGRACVDSLEEVNNFIDKVIAYEEINDSYIIQVLLLGEHLGFGGEAEWGGNHKDKIKPLIPDIYNITTLYDRDFGWDKYYLYNILNKGIHIINHDGHGWTTYALKMRNEDLKKLKNTKYFFLYSQTCLAGSFDNWYPENGYYEDDCFAEHLTCDKYGAFACIMNSRYGLGKENSTDSPGQRYDYSFFKALFEKNIKELGRANHFSKEDNVWRINENGMRWTYYQTNLFGDPQLAIKEPEEKINISIEIKKPLNGIYIFDRGAFFSFINKTFIIGKITIEANVGSEPEGKIAKVNFYINNELKKSLTSEPFSWIWNEKAIGEYKISIEAIAINGKSKIEEKDVFIMNF